MIKRTPFGLLMTMLATVALASGCSKAKDEAKDEPAKAATETAPAETTKTAAAETPRAADDVTASRLLALKFHHDS